jgi:hypothetical protein
MASDRTLNRKTALTMTTTGDMTNVWRLVSYRRKYKTTDPKVLGSKACARCHFDIPQRFPKSIHQPPRGTNSKKLTVRKRVNATPPRGAALVRRVVMTGDCLRNANKKAQKNQGVEYSKTNAWIAWTPDYTASRDMTATDPRMKRREVANASLRENG